MDVKDEQMACLSLGLFLPVLILGPIPRNSNTLRFINNTVSESVKPRGVVDLSKVREEIT